MLPIGHTGPLAPQTGTECEEMTGRLALLTLAGTLCACDAPPPAPAPAPPPAPQALAPALTAQQIDERDGRCERKAREAYLGDSLEGGVAEFESHYSVRLDTCFYLLTTVRQGLITKTLLDINENETYGEFAGTAENWTACRVEGLHCASLREWEVLAGQYMKD